MISDTMSSLDDRALNGLRETYVALGVPGASVAAGILKPMNQWMKLKMNTKMKELAMMAEILVKKLIL